MARRKRRKRKKILRSSSPYSHSSSRGGGGGGRKEGGERNKLAVGDGNETRAEFRTRIRQGRGRVLASAPTGKHGSVNAAPTPGLRKSSSCLDWPLVTRKRESQQLGGGGREGGGKEKREAWRRDRSLFSSLAPFN